MAAGSGLAWPRVIAALGVAAFQLAPSAPGLPGQTASIVFESPPVLSGLENMRATDGGDGEGDLLLCGPAGDRRGAIRLRGEEDGDLPDAHLYFRIDPATHGAIKSSSDATVTAVVHDAPELAGSLIALEYNHVAALDGRDLPRVFFRHPFQHLLEGNDRWLRLSWSVRGAGFESLQHGIADFRLSGSLPAGGIARFCLREVEVAAGAPPLSCPTSLTASVDGDSGEVSLRWSPAGSFRRIRVLRNGRLAALLPGTAESFTDDPGPGRHLYELVALPAGDSCATVRLRAEARVFPPVSACGCPDPDANRDGAIDHQDLAIVSSNVGLRAGDPAYTLAADADRNRVVDMADVQLVLSHLGSLPPPPAAERALQVRGALPGVSSPGPLVRIRSPYARGSGMAEADPQSLLEHGRLLVLSLEGGGRLLEVDPRTGAIREFPAAGKSDLHLDPALAEPTGLDFSGPQVWVTSRALPRPAGAVGSVALLDRRSGAPLAGPTGTGVFAGNEDAVDPGLATASLDATSGLAPGGAAPDGAPGEENLIYFQTSSESALGDGAVRSASLTAVDLDTGLYRIASLEERDGLPEAIAFEATGDPQAMMPLAAAIVQAEAGLLRGPGLALSPDGERLVTREAGAGARVLLEVAGLPGDGEYVVRARALLPGGTGASSFRLEAVETRAALERRLRSGVQPGKLGAELRVVAAGRLPLQGGAAGNHLILRFPEPGLEIDALEFEGPVAGRLYVGTRDPGSVRVYGLGLTGGFGEPGTRYRGILERVIGTCPVEAGRGSECLLDPVALEIHEQGGLRTLYVLDGVRSTLGKIPLDGGELEPALPECYLLPLSGVRLGGFALGRAAPGGLTEIYVTTAGAPSPGGGDAPGAGGEAGAKGLAPDGGGIQVVSGTHSLFIDRAASGIVEPIHILERRDLVVRAVSADGSLRDVSLLAAITSLDPGLVVLEPPRTIKARAPAGTARIRAVFEGLAAEAEVCVSPEGFAWRSELPPIHRVRPIPHPESLVMIFPGRQSFEQVFGVEVNAILLPVGLEQPFTAVLLDPAGRASGLDIEWSHSSVVGNSIDLGGDFLALAPEPAAQVGFDQGTPGLKLTAGIGEFAGSEPVSVHDPGSPPGAPAVLKVFPRDLRLTPGSRLRFVSVLLDEDGSPLSHSPEWTCDGLPMDRDTGLLTAEYRGETVDGRFVVLCRDPASGLCDATSVTVAYGETTGIASLPDAQSVFLAQSLFEGALKDLLTGAIESARFKSLEVAEVNAGQALGKLELGRVTSFITDFIADFKFDYLANHLFLAEGVLELALSPPGPDAVVKVRLRLDDVVKGKIKKLRVKFKLKGTLFGLVLGIFGLPQPELDDQEIKKDEISLEVLKDSVLEITGLLDLATGEFCPGPSDCEGRYSGTWKTADGKQVSDAMASMVGDLLGEGLLLAALKSEVLKLLEDILLGPGGPLKLVIDFLCKIAGQIGQAIPVIGEILTREACEAELVALVKGYLKEIVDFAFDLIEDMIDLSVIVPLLGPVMDEYVVQPTIRFAFEDMAEVGILRKLSDAYGSLSVSDDLGRVANLRFAGQPIEGAGLALRDSALPGRLRDLMRVENLTVGADERAFAEFRHAGVLSYQEEGGVLLEGLGAGAPPAGVPFAPGHGLAIGAADLGVTVNLTDSLGSLFRAAGSTAYRKDGAPRGPVPIAILAGKETATAGGHTVRLKASCVSAPHFEMSGDAPLGAAGGRAHLQVLVEATGDLDFTVHCDAVAPLEITREGLKVTIDVARQRAGIRSPQAGEAPFAIEIRDLLATSPSLADLRGFIASDLGGRLPISVEYPARASVAELGFLNLSLVASNSDPGFHDDFLKAQFQADAGAGGGLAALFIRGDCTSDGRVDLDDVRGILGVLYLGHSRGCGGACDADGGGSLELADAVSLLQWLLGRAQPPPAPFPFCGLDPGALDCAGGGHGCP